MSVGQKLAMLKIRSTSVTLLSLHNLEATPAAAMQLRRLIKSSNGSLASKIHVFLKHPLTAVSQIYYTKPCFIGS